MSLHRVFCRFKPSYQKAAGGDSWGPRLSRGAWVVAECDDLHRDPYSAARVFVWDGMVGVLTTAGPRRKGTRVSPRALLSGFLEELRRVDVWPEGDTV